MIVEHNEFDTYKGLSPFAQFSSRIGWKGEGAKRPDDPGETSWEALYALAMNNAAAHRRTGGRLVRDRAGLHSPLPAFVTEETAHVAFADALIAMAEADSGVVDTFQGVPPDDLCGRLVGATTYGQKSASYSPEYALTGSWKGRRHREQFGQDASLEAAADMAVILDPIGVEETIQEADHVLSRLTVQDRETIEWLIEGKQPEAVTAQTWKRLVHKARQAFRREWAAAAYFGEVRS